MNHIQSPQWSSTAIYWLIPNLIGYLRIVLVVSAFCICFDYPYWFVCLYGTSQLLDGLDGYLARRLQQATMYGAMLDMVLDRVSTTALLVLLAKFYPAYTRWFIVLMLLDIVSHFLHVYSSLLYGKRSHKTISTNQHWLLRLYYGYKSILFVLCVGSEACLLWFYLQHFKDFLSVSTCLQPLGMLIITCVLSFLFCVKQVINLIQLSQAIVDVVAIDASKG
jgi:CDP-diacylglycerol--inositol 3-phosphatidyltransferase